jgi:flavodoxin
MKTAILYASTHGKTRKVVVEAKQHLAVSVDVFNVAESENIQSARLETYDQELQDDMEDFLRTFDLNLTGNFFAICELGSYYGYDDFAFGALRLIRQHLLKLNGQELCEPLSLDSFPRVHWRHLLDWIDYLNGKLNEQRHCYA